jgi:PTH1 family peptidyl-tRNA hydrolase
MNSLALFSLGIMFKMRGTMQPFQSAKVRFSVWVIVGLGNPGEEYTKTRHNIGFQCVKALADRHHLSFSGKRARARIAEGVIAGERVVLAKPFTYMNDSGQAVVGLCQWYKVDPQQNLLVIYDDFDLPFGTLRLRARGSAGTHNGMRSIVAQLGSEVFPRLRIGIDRVPPNWNVAKYVLSRFGPEQEKQLPDVCGRAADAVEITLREGLTAAMNRYNAPDNPKRTRAAPSSADDTLA